MPFGLPGQAGVRGVAPPGARALVPCLLGLLSPRGVQGSGCCGPLGCVESRPVLSHRLFVVLLPGCRGRVPFSLRCPCRCVCLVALAVAGVVTWQLGCGASLRSVFGGSLLGVAPYPRVGIPSFPCVEPWWPVGSTHCGSCCVRSGLRRRVLSGLRLRGSCGVDSVGEWGSAGPSGVACPAFACVLVTAVAPSLPVPWLWPFLCLALRWFIAPVLRCPRCPVPVGACLLPWASPRPLAAGLPFALSLPAVVVVGGW